MRQEILLILIFAAVVITLALIRRMQDKKHIKDHEQVVIFEVTYLDRKTTLDFVHAYFKENLITVLDENRFSDSSGEENLYTDTYKLFLPGNMTVAEVVGALSGCETVQSVHTRME